VTPFRVPASWLWRPSPNHSSRGLHKVTAIVCHADASAKVETSLDWIRRAESKVSYHVLIGRNGVIHAVVNPDRKAWHAGVSALGSEQDCNGFTVGVCLSNRNDGTEPYPIAQQGAAADVCAVLCGFYGIPVNRIVTHEAVALPKGRKTDPKGLDMGAFRDMVAARLAPMPGAA
jgi:N-acetyl-anhydromuramyl-L-alanine amidase AmpD